MRAEQTRIIFDILLGDSRVGRRELKVPYSTDSTTLHEMTEDLAAKVSIDILSIEPINEGEVYNDV